ncbi:hypothetical protein F5Y18DRAFT_443633, partial [Xylariaceae sp. FL1019]
PYSRASIHLAHPVLHPACNSHQGHTYSSHRTTEAKMAPQDGEDEEAGGPKKRVNKSLRKKREKVPEPVGYVRHAKHWNDVHDPNSARAKQRDQRKEKNARLRNNKDAVEHVDSLDQHQQPIFPAASSFQGPSRLTPRQETASSRLPVIDLDTGLPRSPAVPSQFDIPLELRDRALSHSSPQLNSGQQHGSQQYGYPHSTANYPTPMQELNNHMSTPSLSSPNEPHVIYQQNYPLENSLLNRLLFTPTSHSSSQPGMNTAPLQQNQGQDVRFDAHWGRNQQPRHPAQPEQRPWSLDDEDEQKKKDAAYDLNDPNRRRWFEREE